MTKALSKDVRDKSADLHKAERKKLGEKVTTVCVSIQKWRKSNSLGEYDHKKGGGSVQNYTEGGC